MSLKNRLQQLVDYEGLNPNQFYVKSGLGNGFLNTVGDILRKPSIEKLEKHFPHWNIHWLLTGEGSMIKENTQITLEPQVDYNRSDISENDERIMLIQSIHRMTDTADRNSKSLEKIIDYLVSRGATKEEILRETKKGDSEGEKGNAANESYKKSAG